MMMLAKVRVAAVVVVGLVVVGVVAVFVLRGGNGGSGTAATQAAGVEPEGLPVVVPAESLDPDRAIAINIGRKWQGTGWGENETLSPTYAMTYVSGHVVFHVGSPRLQRTWIYYLDQPIKLDEYPMLSIRYRAGHIDPYNDRFTLWLDDGTGPSSGGIIPVYPRDLILDGREHEFRTDLRLLNPKGAFKGMALRVHTDAEGQGQFELLDMRLESTDDSEPRTLPQEGPALAVKVLDERQQPVEGAVVSADAERRNFARQARTGADGVATIEKPLVTQDGRHRLRIERDGYATIEVTKEPAETSPIQAMLFKAGRFSGQVVDPEGKAVPGVIVEAGINGEGYDRNRVRMDLGLTSITDEQGRWALTLVDSARCSFGLRFSHADYVSDRWGGQNYKVDMEEVRSGKSIVRLQRGIKVSGTVLNANGNPVIGATVAQGEDRFPSNAPPATVTDKDGRYSFSSVDPGKLVLTVTARGYAPELLVTQAEAGMKPIDFTMKFGKVIRFHVVDQAGNPIAQAGISPDTWRGYRTIPTSLTTNADGWATWNSAPEDAVLYDIFARDHMSVRRKSLVAGGEEEVITLPGVLKISGSVTDANTGDPIPAFSVIEGIQWEGQSNTSWQRRGRPESASARNGRFEHTFSYPYPGHLVRIEAEGYLPAVSRVFKSDEGEQTFDFKLAKAKDVKIQVLTPDGKPAEGAMAAVATASEQLMLRNGSIERNQSSAGIREIDASGRYSLPPLGEGKGVLLITHASGYVQMPYEQAAEKTELRLTPWGKVEAILKVGSNVASQKINVWRNDYTGEPGQPRIFEQLEGQTDANGRCVLDRVRAGTMSVGNYIQVYENAWGSSHSKSVTLEPGGNASVVIGGEGRPVVGRLDIPADFPSARRFDAVRISSKSAPMAKTPYPDGFMGWPVEKRREWMEEWKKTDEGKAFFKMVEEENRKRRSFSGRLNDDGTFRVEDIPAGTYTMNVTIYEPSTGRSMRFEQLGLASGEFTMPEVPGGKSSEVLDVGVLKVVRKMK